MLEIVKRAIEDLTTAFERGGYNPTPIIDIGVLVASADGHLDDREREILLDVFQTLLDTKINAEVVDHLVTASLDVIEAAGPERRAGLVADILADCNAAEPGIILALVVAYASDGFSAAERTVVDRIARGANVSPARVDALVEAVRAKVEDDDPQSIRNILARTRTASAADQS